MNNINIVEVIMGLILILIGGCIFFIPRYIKDKKDKKIIDEEVCEKNPTYCEKHVNEMIEDIKEKEGSRCEYCNEAPIGYVDLLNSYEVYLKNKKTKRFKKNDSGISECCAKVYFCKDHKEDAIDA